MLEAMATSLTILLAPDRFAVLIGGVLLGAVLGFIPGLGGVVGVALLMPFTLFMDAEYALPLIIGMIAVISTTDTIPSVLIGSPGSAGSQATIIDGYPMAKKGEAGKALGAAYISSMIGGIIGALVLTASVPIFRPLVMSFGIAEFFSMGLLGLSMVAVLSGRSPILGITSAGIGIMLSLVGPDPVNAIARWSLGTDYLLDRLDVVAVALGFFAIPEIIDLCVRGTQIAEKLPERKISGMGSGVLAALRNKTLIVCTSMVGALVGFLPGMGTVVANWLAYSTAVMFCRPNDQFGKGDVRGVIAPEGANNASTGGDLIPTIAFGIPGSTVMALVLTTLWAKGITPGRSLLSTNLHLVYLMIWSLALANIIGALLAFTFTNQIAKLVNLPIKVLAPMILLPIFGGAILTHNEIGDVVIMLVFGVIGWVMKHAGWPRPGLILGFVLGPVLEKFYFQTTMVYGNAWLLKPSVLAILCIAILACVFGFRMRPR